MINLDNPTTPNGPLVSIMVNGGDPTASDQLIVNGTGADDQITFTPTGVDAGTVAVPTLPMVTFAATESVVINAGGDNDDVTVDTTNGSQTVTVTPGATIDSGEVRVDSLVPMTFVNLGANGTVTIDDTNQDVIDEVVYMGTAGTDTFRVATLETIELNNQIDVITDDVEEYILKGLGGDDTFDIVGISDPNNDVDTVFVEGDEPGSGSDVLEYTSVGATTVDFQDSNDLTSISDAGFNVPDVVFSGVEAVNVDANGQALEVEATDIDDVIIIRPLGTASATVDVAGQPLVTATNVSTTDGDFLVDASTGPNSSDAVTVEGNEDDNTIIVDLSTSPNVAVDALLRVDLALTDGDSLTIAAGAGSDDITITPDAVVPIFVQGGDPIGGSDNLTIDAGSDDVAFNVGPESDSGAFTVGANAPVSFDEIEGLSVTGDGTGKVTIIATNADNDITVIGTGADDFTVSIDGSPAVQFTDFAELEVDGLAGDDDIDIDINDLDLDAFDVIGGLPSTDLDTVTFTGVEDALNDNASWSPNAVDGGTFDVGAQSVELYAVERLIYDGEGGDETLTVNGFAPANRFVHTPGAAGDDGSIGITDLGNDDSGLGIEYIDLGLQGLINIVGSGGGDDILVAFGTASNDAFTVVAPTGDVTLESNYGAAADREHVPLSPSSIEALVLDGLDGDDTFTVVGGHPYALGISLEGGDPSASDTAILYGDGSDVVYNTGTSVQTVTGGGLGTPPGPGVGPLTLTGIEHVDLNAFQGNIDVNGTATPNTFHVTPTGADTAEILVDGVNQVLNTDNTGLLTIAEGTAGDGDTVNVYGTSQDDTINIDRNTAVPSTRVEVGTWKDIDVDQTDVEVLNVDAGQGDDEIYVVNAGGPALTVDGGQPTGLPATHDTLDIEFANAGIVDVDPGATPDAGFIFGPTSGEDVAFMGMELIDLTGTGESTLVVNGTSDVDAITQDGDIVYVNDRAPVMFAGFPTLEIDALEGDDAISVAPASLSTTVTTFNVYGGDPTASDELIVNGRFGTDDLDIMFTPDGQDSGEVDIDVTDASLVPVDFTGIENVVINAGGDNDDVTVDTTYGAQTVTVTPGATVDSGEVRVDSLVPLEFVNLGASGTLTIDDSSSDAVDEVVYMGTAATDRFAVAGTETIELNDQIDLNTVDIEEYFLKGLGGDDTFDIQAVDGVLITVEGDEPGGSSDVINFTSTADATIDLEASTIDDTGVGGSPDVVYSGIETINADLAGYTLTVEATDDDDDITVTLFDATSGQIELGLGVQQNGQVATAIDTPLINYFNTDTTANVNFDLEDGQDTLVVVGNALEQTFDVDVQNSRVSVDDAINGLGDDGVVTYTENRVALRLRSGRKRHLRDYRGGYPGVHRRRRPDRRHAGRPDRHHWWRHGRGLRAGTGAR